VYVDVHEDCDEPELPTDEPEDEIPEVSDQLLEIGFTTAFHAAQPFHVEPGQEVILGSVMLHNPYGEQLSVMTLQIDIGIDTDGNEIYAFGDGELISQYVQSCQLRGWPQIVDYSDPSPVTDEGKMVAVIGMSIGGEYAWNADIVCQFTDTVPEQQIGIMADLPIPAVATVFDQQGLPVQSVITETNGNPPRVAALISAEEEPIEDDYLSWATVEMGETDPYIMSDETIIGNWIITPFGENYLLNTMTVYLGALTNWEHVDVLYLQYENLDGDVFVTELDVPEPDELGPTRSIDMEGFQLEAGVPTSFQLMIEVDPLWNVPTTHCFVPALINTGPFHAVSTMTGTEQFSLADTNTVAGWWSQPTCGE